jgi:superfamily I DNA/RNA helicase
MAEMIPDVPVGDAPRAERDVYRWLQDGLPETFRVFHSLPFVYRSGSSGLRDGEIDFLITHPTRGLLFLEVKGGAEIRYDGSEQAWISVEHGGGPSHTIKDPLKQAQKSQYQLLDKIVDAGVVERKGDLPLPFGYACWFPGASRVQGELPPHADPTLLLTRSDRRDPEQAIRKAMGAWKGEDHEDPDDCRDVYEAVTRRVLQPEFRVVRSLRTQIQSAEETFSRLTEEQAELFDGFLQANRRALVKGYAGTGKTFLAAHRAAELGRDGRDTLLLCFNRHLADHLARKMEGVPNVDVATFHQLADEWSHHAPDRSFPDNPDQQFWESGSAELLMAAIEHAGIQYDAILVDEAQDFREAWWYPVESMLKADARFYVFVDPGQNVYGTDVKGLMDLPTTVPLRKNCRSSTPISRFATRLTERHEDVSPEHVGDGPEVQRRSFEDRAEQIEMLEQITRELKQDEGLSSSEIVLLSPHSYDRSLLADAGYRIGGYDIEPFQLEEPSEGTLYYESLQSFKGMESPAVVLFDVRDGHVASSDTNVYVGCTRARHLLYVLHEDGWSPDDASDASQADA